MKRFVWGAVFAAVLVLTGVALWMLHGERAPRRARTREGEAEHVARGSAQVGRTRRPTRRVSLAEPSLPEASGLRAFGEILDAEGTPLGDARLSLWCLHPDLQVTRLGSTMATDEHGRFEGPACRHQICVELHDPSWIPRDPWVLEPEQAASLVAVPVPRLSGRVEDERGSPLVGVRVTALPPAEDADPLAHLPVTVRTTTTDGDGTFTFPKVTMPPCGPCDEARGLCGDRALELLPEIRLVAMPAGYAAASVDVSLESEAATGTIVLRAAATSAELRGTLTDGAGRSFPEAYVLARSQERSYEVRRAEAGEGTFVFRSLGSGLYDLEALYHGQSLAKERDVAPGEPVVWVVDRSAAMQSVVLEVRNAQGPLADVRVDGPGPWAGLRTDARGQTTPVQVLEGMYRIRVHIPGKRRPERLEVVVPGGEDRQTRTVSAQVGGE